MQVPYVQRSPRLMGNNIRKSQVFFEWHKWFKESSHFEITNKDSVHHFPRYAGYYSLWTHSTRLKSQPSLLYGNTEAVTRNYAWRNAWTFSQRLDSPPWQWPSSQGAFCQEVSGPKIDDWNGTPTIFPWFRSKWLLAVSGNKMCSNLRIFRILKTSKKMWRRHWKLFHNRSSKNVSNSGRQHHWDKCIAAQGEYFEGDPSQ